MFKKKRTSVGIDIGYNSVKLVALREDSIRQRQRLIKYGIKNYPPAEGEKKDDVIAGAIKELYHETRLDEKKVRVALSGNSIVVRYVSLPKMTLEEAKKCVKYEGDQHIPFSLDDVEIDCDILRGNGSSLSEEENGSKMEIILAAVRKEAGQKLLDLLDRVGLTPVVVDVNSIAVINAFTQAAVDGNGETVAVVHIGAGNSDISILQNDVPVFTRYIEIGGNELTSAISKGLGIEMGRAEELKISGDTIVSPFAEGVFEAMARDIRSSFDYYEGVSGLDVSRLYLSGGGSLYQEAPNFLSSSLGIETDFWDPFARVDTSGFKSDQKFKSLGRIFDVAIGLALRRVEK